MYCKGGCHRILIIDQEKRGFCEWCWKIGKQHAEEFKENFSIKKGEKQ